MNDALDVIAFVIALAGILAIVVVMVSSVCWLAWMVLQALIGGVELATILRIGGCIALVALFLWALDRTSKRI